MIVLQRARALAAERSWPDLVEHLRVLAEHELQAQIELAVLYADALRRVGDAPASLRVASRAEPAVRSRGDRRLLLDLINITGMALFESGRMAEAEKRFAELLERATECADEEFAARASNNLGVLANVRGRYELALNYYQRALAAYQRLGYTRGLAQTYHNLGISYRDLGRDSEADAQFRRAIELGQNARSEDVIALAESERAMLCARSGDGDLAEAFGQRALRRQEKLGDPLGRAEALRVLAAAAKARRDPAAALDRLDEALRTACAHPDPLLRAEVQRDRALLLRERGESAAARDALLEAAEHFQRLGAAAQAEEMHALLAAPLAPPT
jgi:tetratricopeptide (TPR) repeat protein